MNLLRALRIELGQTQEAIAQRAKRPKFERVHVARAEAPKPEGLRSHEIRMALAAGLGLDIHDFDAYMAGKLPLETAVARSSVEPDLEMAAKLKANEAKRASRSMELGDDDKPHLRLALIVARENGMPEEFIAEYEATAREVEEDRLPLEWLDEMRARLGPWKRQRRAERSAAAEVERAATAARAKAPKAGQHRRKSG